MEAFDRRANLSLFGGAALAWLVVGLILVTFDPRGAPLVAAVGSVAIGAALGITSVPLFWLAAFSRQRRIAYHGDWPRALRRGAWVAGLAALFVFLRAEGLFSLPVAVFVVALAVVAEGALSGRK